MNLQQQAKAITETVKRWLQRILGGSWLSTICCGKTLPVGFSTYVPLVHVVHIEWPTQVICSTQVGFDTTPNEITIGDPRIDGPLELCLTFRKKHGNVYLLALKLDESLHG